MVLLPGERRLLSQDDVFVLTNKRIAVGALSGNWKCAWLRDVAVVHVEHFSQGWLWFWGVTNGVVALIAFKAADEISRPTDRVVALLGVMLLLNGIVQVGRAIAKSKRILTFGTSGGDVQIELSGMRSDPSPIINAYQAARHALETESAGAAPTAGAFRSAETGI